MSKPRRKRHVKMPLRLPPDVTLAVSQLSNGTGWSANKALALIARTGWNALNGGGDKIPAMRQVMTAAVAHHETLRTMRRRIAITADKLRAAQKAIS